jgi:hypothetical protein
VKDIAARLQKSFSKLLERLRVETRIDSRIDQSLQRDARKSCIPRQQANHGSQVAPRRLAQHRHSRRIDIQSSPVF